jgi:hypothetical protein
MEYTNGIIPLELIQGEDFEIEVSLEDSEGTAIDVAGYTAAMDFKKNAGDTKKYIELSTDVNGGITVDTVNNVLRINIAKETINALKVNNLVTDLFVTSPLDISTKLFSANVAVSKRVTA